MQITAEGEHDPSKLAALTEKLDDAVRRLEEAGPVGKASRQGPVLEIARRLLAEPGGAERLYERISRIEAAGIFDESDWEHPESLQAAMAARTLRLADAQTTLLECLSELRMIAVARRDYFHPRIASEQAEHFLAQAVGLNLDLLVAGGSDEAMRGRPKALRNGIRNLYAFIVAHIGYGEIIDQLVAEIWRLLSQRPIVVDDVKSMIAQISVWIAHHGAEAGSTGWGTDRLISAVFSPTAGCRDDPGIDGYLERVAAMDDTGLAHEAGGFSRAMHDTGLVSDYHAAFLRHVAQAKPDLIATTLGLSATGTDALRCYPRLVHALIDKAIHVETGQAVYGLALMLERGVLYIPAMGPALWRQLALRASPQVAETIRQSFGDAHPPEVILLAGVLSVLGQPLGVGQGNNPTCQSARAISMWAYNDPDYLLQMVTWAARDGEVIIHFEGQPISSRDLAAGLAEISPSDVDPVSAVVVPHLDRIYVEMGRLCAQRGEDPHRWVNPELHGWWVGRGYDIAVDVASGMLSDYDDFLRRFYAAYHPYYNGDQPVIHPQPAGLAITDSAARFVGWHAIAIYRVALDREGAMRVYFVNPNNDSGQDWGDGVVVSTESHGERYGESSLPIVEFASRLYLFHFDPLEQGKPEAVPGEELAEIEARARRSWAAER